ncbi:hypothetical protein AAZX31_08G306700 [Glycine max]
MDQGEDFQVKKLHISLQSSLLSLDLQGRKKNPLSEWVSLKSRLYKFSFCFMGK